MNRGGGGGGAECTGGSGNFSELCEVCGKARLWMAMKVSRRILNLIRNSPGANEAGEG